MRPRIVEQASFHVVGLQGRYTPETTSQIAALWGRFAPQMATIPGRRGMNSFGTCHPDTCGTVGNPAFEYTACVAVDSLARVPAGLIGFTIPAGRFAVFTHEGAISRIGATFDAIFCRWLPEAGLERADGYDYELYDERFDPHTGTGDVDIFVPVRPAVAKR